MSKNPSKPRKPRKSAAVDAIVARIQTSAIDGIGKVVCQTESNKIYHELMAQAREYLDAYRQEIMSELAKINRNQESGFAEILPNNVRYVQKTSYGRVVVTEYAPQVRTLNFAVGERGPDFLGEYHNFSQIVYMPSDHNGTHFKRYRLALPYMVFMFFIKGTTAVDRMLVAINNKPLASLNDKLYLTPLPNVWGNNQVCMGHVMDNTHARTVAGTIDMWTSAFWSSTFNRDVPGNFAWYKDQIGSIVEWEKKSAEDALFPLNWKMFPAAESYEPMGNPNAKSEPTIAKLIPIFGTAIGSGRSEPQEDLHRTLCAASQQALYNLQERFVSKKVNKMMVTAITRILQNALFEQNLVSNDGY